MPAVYSLLVCNFIHKVVFIILGRSRSLAWSLGGSRLFGVPFFVDFGVAADGISTSLS
jgi:hypothetical protein